MFRALEFIENYRISEEELILARPRSLIIVRKTSENGITWKELQRIIEKIAELIEAAMILLYSIAEISQQEIIFAPAILSSINFASPGSVQIKVDCDVANLTKVVLEKIQFWGIDKNQRIEELKRIALENEGHKLNNDRLRNENINLQIENLRNVVKFRKDITESGIPKEIADAVFIEAMRCLGIKQLPHNISEPGSLEYGIIKDRFIPAVAELAAGDDPQIDVEVKEIPSDESNNN